MVSLGLLSSPSVPRILQVLLLAPQGRADVKCFIKSFSSPAASFLGLLELEVSQMGVEGGNPDHLYWKVQSLQSTSTCSWRECIGMILGSRT